MMRRRLGALMGLLLILSLAAPDALAKVDSAARWQWVAPLPVGGDLNAVAFGHGQYVAVGGGRILLAKDAKLWSPAAQFAQYSLSSVAFADGLFVAVGYTDPSLLQDDPAHRTSQSSVTVRVLGPSYGNAVILTSPDGRTWTQRLLDQNRGTGLAGVAYGAGRWLAVAEDGPLYTSHDGNNWSRSGTVPVGGLHTVLFGGGRFLAVGADGVTATSADGFSWQTGNVGLHRPYLSAAAYGDKWYVVGAYDGSVYRSTDGRTWELMDWLWDENRSGSITALIHDGSRFMAFSAGDTFFTLVMVSTDGEAWVKGGDSFAAGVGGAGYLGGRYVAVGLDGQIVTSEKGERWVRQTAPPLARLSEVVFAGGRFVAAGFQENCGVIAQSVDGQSWQLAAASPSSFKNLAYGAGRFVAVGSGQILTSADGIRWEPQSGEPYDSATVAYGEEGFLAAKGQQPVRRSKDGRSWQNTDFTPDGFVRYLAAGGGQYLALLPMGVVWRYDQGKWTRHTLPTTDDLTSAAYGAGRWVVGGFNGTLLSSADGENWESYQFPGGEVGQILYADGEFVVAGQGSSLMRSPDGRNWQTIHVDNLGGYVSGLAFGKGRYVAVGGGDIQATGIYAMEDTAAPPDLADPKRSTLTAAASQALIGLDAGLTVTAVLKDSAGRPLAGQLVKLYSKAEGWYRPYACGVTGADGSVAMQATSLDTGKVDLTLAVLPDRIELPKQIPVTYVKCGELFPDVAQFGESCQAAGILGAYGVVQGGPDGKFYPSNPLTRAELAKMLVLALGKAPDPDGELPFTDTEGHWAADKGYIQTAVKLKLMRGFADGSFRPNRPVSRDLLIQAVAQAAGLKPAGDWWAAARTAGLIGEKARFRVFDWTPVPVETMTYREEAALVLANLLSLSR